MPTEAAVVERAEPETTCSRCLEIQGMSPHQADYVVKITGYSPVRTCGRHLADTIDIFIPPKRRAGG